MKKFSNTYIFLYTTVLVAIVAIVLSLVTLKLKPLQDRNRDVEKMRQILSAAGYSEMPTEKVQDFYNAHSQEWLLDKQGNVTDIYANGKFTKGNARAFTSDEKLAYLNAQQHKDYVLPVFVIKSGGRSVFVVPVRGKGLWGPIWGYVAIADDGNTVVGTSFSHKSETPGLGGEITKDKFQSQFKNKTIFDDNGTFVSVQVVKGGVARSHANPKHAVDAMSGATITSHGVDNMLNTCLKLYVPFFQKNMK